MKSHDQTRSQEVISILVFFCCQDSREAEVEQTAESKIFKVWRIFDGDKIKNQSVFPSDTEQWGHERSKLIIMKVCLRV